MKLDIPFYSQRHNRDLNDCGPAVLACLLDRPIDDILKAIEQPKDQPMSFHHFYYALRYFGLAYSYSSNLTPDNIVGLLDQGQAVIMLLTYGRLPAELKATSFDGSHWALAVGHDENHIFVHDPLRTSDEGGFQPWDKGSLKAALNDTSINQVPRQGLIIRRVWPSLPAGAEESGINGRLLETAGALAAELQKLTERNVLLEGYLYQIYQALDIKEAVSETAQTRAVTRAMLRTKRGKPTDV